jgi:hypothetical protein
MFEFDTALDGDLATIEIESPAGASIVGPTATGVGDLGSGAYSYVWSASSLLTAGLYAATVTGEIDNEAVSEVVTVTVSSRPLYASLATLRDELQVTATGGNARFLRALSASSQAIDDYTDTRFYRDGVASARRYLPDSRLTALRGIGELLIVDDMAGITALTVRTGAGSTWATVSGTIAGYPDNAIARGRAVSGLVMVGGSWPRGGPMVEVTPDDWGWPAVPPTVEQACLIQSMRLAHRYTSPEGVAGSAEFGGPIRIPRLDPDVQGLLQRYVRTSVG